MADPLTIAVTIASAAALTGFQTQQQKKKLREAEKKARNRIDVMLRSATEAQRIIYGERRVSGVLTYANVRLSTGTADNSDLWQVIALAGHEVNAITDLYLDGDKIPAASINGSGEVTAGKYAPISGRPTVQILKNLGSDSQSALNIGFADWTSDHRLRGVAHIATRFELSTRGSGGLWKNGAPSNVREVVQGKKVYDPRLDSTAGGSGSHRVDDPSTWEYSANPALCLADYMIDSRLGMGQEGITADDIDYEMVATAADQCDATVSVPGGTEPRYEINGVLFSTDSYEKNILDILSCMNGTMVWSNGQFRIRAGEYEAPVESFDEDDIVGSVSISAERGREERINKIRGSYANADENYDLTQYIPVEDANLIANRDNGNELVETIDQPLVTSEYQAQRLAFKLIQINNQQLRATIPLNYRAMNVRVGDRIQVSVAALNWSNKVFRVEGWKFGVEDGFVLSVIEDSSTAYDDPEVADYSTRSATGTITFADPPVPSPSGLTVTSQRNGILVEWDEPEPPVLYDEVQVFASPDSSWSNAVLVASTRGTTFFHDLDPGTERYYWARSIDNKDELSDRDPDSDTSSVVATAGAVGAGDVDGISAGQNLLPKAAGPEDAWTGTFGLTLTRSLDDYGLEVGDVVSVGMDLRSATGADTLRATIQFRDASNAVVSSLAGSLVTSSSYQRSVEENVTIPAGTDRILVYPVNQDTTETAYVRRMMLNRGPVALPFEEPPARVNRGEVEEGAQVNGAGSLAIVINRELDDTVQNGEACLLGVVNGEPDFDTDGFIFWNGSKITIERNQDGGTPGVTLLTQASRSLGHIVFDTAKGNPFTVNSTAMDVAFARRNGSGWEYDNNGSWTSFTPDDDMVSLGPMDAGGDFIYGAALWGQPIRLVDAPQARAGLWSELLDDDGNIPAPRATRGVIDAASAETDGEVTNASTTTYTTAQTLTFTLSESTTVVITMSGLIYRKFSSSTTFSTVIAEKDGVEIGGMSALNTLVPGTAYLPWVYRREETLGAGTYTYRFRFKQTAGGITTAFRNRVITVEEIL